MNPSSMIVAQQSSGLWKVDRGQALQLTIGPGKRHLRVREGRLWLTGDGASEAPAEDIWIAPGEDVELAEGAHVVAEGWPRASFELIVPPQSCDALSAAQRAWAWWSRWSH